MYFLSQPKEDVFIKHATFIHRLKKFHIMCKRFNSNTKNMMICNSQLSKKVGNTPIHSRLRNFHFEHGRTYSDVSGIDGFSYPKSSSYND